METKELYYDNPFLRRFAAVVTSCEEAKGGWAVTLDQTAFYPEGGGQPYDTGTLGGAQVREVREKDGVIVYHAGTAVRDGKLVNSGGRVLGVTARGKDLQEAVKKAYEAVSKISWTGMQYRKDIAHRAFNR